MRPGLCSSWPSGFSCLGLRVESPGRRTKEEGLSKAAVLARGQPGAQVCSGGAGYQWGRDTLKGPWDGVSSPGAASRKWLPAQQGERVAASPFSLAASCWISVLPRVGPCGHHKSATSLGWPRPRTKSQVGAPDNPKSPFRNRPGCGLCPCLLSVDRQQL